MYIYITTYKILSSQIQIHKWKHLHSLLSVTSVQSIEDNIKCKRSHYEHQGFKVFSESTGPSHFDAQNNLPIEIKTLCQVLLLMRLQPTISNILWWKITDSNPDVSSQRHVQYLVVWQSLHVLIETYHRWVEPYSSMDPSCPTQSQGSNWGPVIWH